MLATDCGLHAHDAQQKLLLLLTGNSRENDKSKKKHATDKLQLSVKLTNKNPHLLKYVHVRSCSALQRCTCNALLL